MNRFILCCMIVMLALGISAQTLDVDKYLLKGDQVPQVLLVGTFHFGYPGLDTHKTDDKYKLDILSDERQEELRELLDYIKKFKPTKIMVETGSNTGYLMHRMRSWLNGEEKLGRRESDQIAIRLAHELQLDTIYGIDAPSLMSDMFNSKDSTLFQNYFADILEDRPDKTNVVDDRYWDWYDEDDRLTYEMRLHDYFKYQNTDKVIERMHGHYVLNDHYDDYYKMDGWLLLDWYSRNLRIIKNLQRIETYPDDRIMILFGAGHMAILKQQLEATPEYKLVKFGDLQEY